MKFIILCVINNQSSKNKELIENFGEKLPNSEEIEKKQLCLPLYVGLKSKELNYIIKSLEKTLKIV